MFSPGSFEKNLSENNSPGRNKFAVGINPLGDESQQNFRIQLAVHRYNNSTNNSFNRTGNDRNISTSPIKHAFLKSFPKCRNFENDKEESSTSSRKTVKQYLGIGNFPVVHLKKKTIINKAVRRPRNGEFKVQVPDLPFNRFMNHTPKGSLDTKASTRSVLDVLQDLSKKRIHTKDETEVKRKLKGLGGDAPLDIEAPYKPLFVSKTKNNPVATRDSTTQTLEMPLYDFLKLKKNEAGVNGEPDDPRAELRRKLARQNNEISASLSSSILSYSVKRKLDNVTQSKDNMQHELNTKKVKYSAKEHLQEKNKENGGLKASDVSTAANNSIQPIKIDKKQKKSDKIKLSPNKDRLTAIFLEMQNVKNKSEMLSMMNELETSDGKSLGSVKDFMNNSSSKRSNNLNTSNVNENLNIQSTVQTNSGPDTKTFCNDNIAFGSSFKVSKESILPNTKETNNSSIVNTTASMTLLSSDKAVTNNSNLKLDTSSLTPTLKIPLASTVSNSLSQKPIFSTGISINENYYTANNNMSATTVASSVNDGKNDTKANDNINSSEQKVTFSSSDNDKNAIQDSNEKVMVETFKFDDDIVNAHQNQSPLISTSPSNSTSNNPGNLVGVGSQQSSNFEKTSLTTDMKNETKESISILNGESANKVSSNVQFNCENNNTLTTVIQDRNVSTLGASEKMLNVQTKENASNFAFNFGQISNTNSPTSIQSTLFNSSNKLTNKLKLDEKTTLVDKKNDNVQQEQSKTVTNAATTSHSLFQTSTLPIKSTTAGSFGQSFIAPSEQICNTTLSFKFGEKENNQKDQQKTEITLSNSTSNLFGQKTNSGIFTFGQKSLVQDTPASNGSVISQSSLFSQNNIFSFGQKTISTTSTPSTKTTSSPFAQDASKQSNLFQQNNGNESKTAMNTLMNPVSFGLASQTPNTLNQSVNSVSSFIQTTSVSGTNLGSMSNSFNQNKLNIPTFGNSSSFAQNPVSNFSTEKSIFASNSSQNVPAFGTNSIQTNPFSQVSGDNSKKQQNNFTQNSNFFMQPSITQASGFGQNSTTFGSNTFGQKLTTENNMACEKGVSQIGGFNQTQTVQSNTSFGHNSTPQTFGSQAPFSFGNSVSSSTSFTLNPMSTAASVFTFGNSNKTTSPSSNFSFSSASQPVSSSQSLFTFNGLSNDNNSNNNNNSNTNNNSNNSNNNGNNNNNNNNNNHIQSNNSNNNNAFKFGATTSKDTISFGSGSSGTFTFGASSTTAPSEVSKSAAPVFNFGNSQIATSNSGFNYGSTPSPSVFSFSGSNSSGNGNSKFVFGATQPTGMFTPIATPSPSIQVPLQGVFSIGSGSSQPRSRSSTARARRRT